jgi:hypothetical protein
MSLSINGGLLGLLHLAVSIWAIISVVNSRSGNLSKTLWVLFILFFPVLGLIVWFFGGPKSRA